MLTIIRGSNEAERGRESGSANSDYLVENYKFFTSVPEYVPAFIEQLK